MSDMETMEAQESNHVSDRTVAMVIASAVVFGIAAILTLLLLRRSPEKFSAESFASTVVAQNPKVFERLAEM